MFVKEISLEGFKSYAQRVVIPGFDPQFNAITGLNGSGKSNILDSICFVLGIQNLQQVRANSLQELVYKQGQAGITKATVSITFDNMDKERSPVGYEHMDEITVTRQLVIGGKNKYMINGRTAEPTRVQNLFHSVQLNVNNPHFLIMQGRITKVLNMKPPEILGLLEEAAGTKMYETKKQAALRTLLKKQVKVDEINKVLMDDIMPALDKLRKEKVHFMEWQDATANLERLERFCIAYKYSEAKSLQEDGATEISTAEELVQNLDSEIKVLEIRLNEKEDEIKGLQTEKELQSNGEVKELVQKVDELSKRLVKDTSQWSNAKEGLESEQLNFQQLCKNMGELSEEKLNSRLQEVESQRDCAARELEMAKQRVEAAQNELAGAETGDGRDASNRSLQEQLATAQNSQMEADAEAKAASTRIKHLTKQLQEVKKTLVTKEKNGNEFMTKFQAEAKLLQELKHQIADLNFDAEAAKSMEENLQTEKSKLRKLQDEVDKLSSQLMAINFEFQDPERNFDRTRVKGTVAKLVHVEDAAATTALEVAAGGKLYQVVVDSEETAKALLSKGQLRNRVTIIPLNKISNRPIPNAVIEAGKKMVGTKARPAIQFVGYNKELESAMQYVFGNCFICDDSASAKKLAFTKEVGIRSVTMEGDDFNPGGTLTGGSRRKGPSVLTQLTLLAEMETSLTEQKAIVVRMERELHSLDSARKEHDRLTKQLGLRQHSLELLQKRLEGSDIHQLTQNKASFEDQLNKAGEELKSAQDKKEEQILLARSLQEEINNFGKDKDKRIKAAKEKVKQAKSNLESSKKVLKAAESAVQVALAEHDNSVQERASLNGQMQSVKENITILEQQVEQLGITVKETKTMYDESNSRLEELRLRLKECDGEIAAAIKEKDGLQKQRNDSIIERKKIFNRMEGVRKAAHDATDRCQALEREYPWIVTEKPHFGKLGSDYDWQTNDPNEVFKQYERATTTIDSLSKRVNKKVMQMFEKAEQEYNELKRKKDVVENDKRKIEQVMDELDEKKREALQTTWKKVNADMGSIFSTLLPGATAKLEPEEGKTFLDGLEVKVAFGNVWKESLSELSGGQKSLLALSLILAMLLFKPAPIYILDEVDAALDLSHTQNIGRMIKAHFPQSQFIVVSLKEGMFNNANVLFRTKFIDGISTVARTVNHRDQKSENRTRKILQENVRS